MFIKREHGFKRVEKQRSGMFPTYRRPNARINVKKKTILRQKSKTFSNVLARLTNCFLAKTKHHSYY
jgi:hypothetical protein